MNETYEEYAEKLKTKGKFFSDNIFDYEFSEHAPYFKGFFEFCIEHFRIIGLELNIEDTVFLYLNDIRVNAKAGFTHNQKYIGVNSGTIIRLADFAKDLASKAPILHSLTEALDVPLDLFVFQFNSLFVFYHELGHIIQDPFNNFSSLGEDVKENPYSEYRHILEIDADWYAANRLCHHIKSKWDSFPSEFKTKSVFSELINISLTGIIVFLYETFDVKMKDFYLKKYWHPHPALRLMIVLTVISDRLRNDFGLSQETVMKSVSTFITSIEGKESTISNFLKIVETNRPEMLEYIGELLEKAKKIENLTNKKFKS